MGRTFAVALVASVLGVCALSGRASAAPGDGSGSGDIEIEPDPPAPDANKPAEPAAAAVKDPKAAKKWLTAAQQLVVKGDALAKKGKSDESKAQYDNAVIAFAKSIEAGDDVNVYFALGTTQDKLGNFPEAVKAYRVVAAATKGVRADVAKQLPSKLDAALAKVGTVTLAIQPDDTTVTLNGTELGKSPLPGALVLLPGTYKITLTSPNYTPKEDIEIVVEAGSESERKLELDPLPVDTHPRHEEAYVPPPPPPPVKPSKAPLIVGGVITIGALGTGLVLGELAVKQRNIFVAANSTKNERLDAKDNGRALAHAADGCFAGAVVGAAFTAGWYVFKYRGSHEKQPKDETLNPNAPKLVLAPWVQPDVGGLAAMGQF